MVSVVMLLSLVLLLVMSVLVVVLLEWLVVVVPWMARGVSAIGTMRVTLVCMVLLSYGNPTPSVNSTFV